MTFSLEYLFDLIFNFYNLYKDINSNCLAMIDEHASIIEPLLYWDNITNVYYSYFWSVAYVS